MTCRWQRDCRLGILAGLSRWLAWFGERPANHYFKMASNMLGSLFSRRHQSRRRTTQAINSAIVESLEDRTLLSGNVIVRFDGITLNLNGDSAGNDVEVLIGESGNYEINGLNGTTVNGQSQLVGGTSGFANVVAMLNDGADKLNLRRLGENPVTLDGRIWIDLGRGMDELSLSDLGFRGGASVFGRQGNDTIQFNNFTAGNGLLANLIVDAGQDNDTVRLQNINSQKNVIVYGGSGLDDIKLSGANVGMSVVIAGNADSDVINVQDVNVGGFIDLSGDLGDDVLRIDNAVVRQHVRIDGSLGDDVLEVSRSTVDASVILTGGIGKDALAVRNSTIRRNLGLLGGMQNDVTAVEDSVVDGRLYWDGGLGDDGFGMTGSTVGGFFILNGNLGEDLIGIADGKVLGGTYIYGSLGNDALVISDTPGGPNAFDRNVFISMGFGDDVVQICGTHSFARDLKILGGWFKHDRVNIQQMQDVGGGATVIQFENTGDATVSDRTEKMFLSLADDFPEILTTPLSQLCNGTPIDDHGNTAAAATPVVLPSSTPGVLEMPFDVDVFSFAAVAGTKYTLETTLGSLVDSRLRLFGTDGTMVLATNDDGGPGNASLMEFTAPVTGTFFVEVGSNLSGGTGSYMLDISAEITPPPTGEDTRTNDTSDIGMPDQPLARLGIGDTSMLTGFVGAASDNGDTSDSRAIKFETTAAGNGLVNFSFTNNSQSSLSVKSLGGNDPNAKNIIDVTTVGPAMSIQFTIPESLLGTVEPCLNVEIQNMGTTDAMDGDINYSITVNYELASPPSTGTEDTRDNDQSGRNMPETVMTPGVGEASSLTGYLGNNGTTIDSVDEYRFDITSTGDTCGDFSFVVDSDITVTAFRDGTEIQFFGQEDLSGRTRYDYARSPLRELSELIVRLEDLTPTADSTPTNYTMVFGVHDSNPADSRTTDLSSASGPIDIGDGGNCFASADTLTGYVGTSGGTSETSDAYRLNFVTNSTNVQTVNGTVSATSSTPIQYSVMEGSTVLASGTVQPGLDGTFSVPRDQSGPPIIVSLTAIGSTTDTAATTYSLEYELTNVAAPPPQDTRSQDRISATSFEQIQIPGKIFSALDLGDIVSFNGFVDAGTDPGDRPLIVLSNPPAANTMITVTFENKASVPRTLAFWGREQKAGGLRQLNNTTVAAGETLTVTLFNTTDSFIDLGLDIQAPLAGMDTSGLDQNYCVTVEYTNSTSGITMSGTVRLTNDLGMDGFIDPGDMFEVDVLLTNTSTMPLTFSYNPMSDVIVNGAGINSGVSSLMSPITIQPGQSVTVGTVEIEVPPPENVTPPAPVFVFARATSDGTPLGAFLSPITVGVTEDQATIGGTVVFGVHPFILA